MFQNACAARQSQPRALCQPAVCAGGCCEITSWKRQVVHYKIPQQRFFRRRPHFTSPFALASSIWSARCHTASARIAPSVHRIALPSFDDADDRSYAGVSHNRPVLRRRLRGHRRWVLLCDVVERAGSFHPLPASLRRIPCWTAPRRSRSACLSQFRVFEVSFCHGAPRMLGSGTVYLSMLHVSVRQHSVCPTAFPLAVLTAHRPMPREASATPC